jgi:hypothetical protein
VVTELVHAQTVGLEHLGHQQPQLAVTQHGDLGAARNIYLVQNLARGRQRLDEDGLLSGNAIGQHMQVALGQRKEFAKRPRMFYDAQYFAGGAVAPQAFAAPAACSAIQIDFTDHAPADQITAARFDDFAHELVPGNSQKTVVAALQLQVGIANAATQKPDEGEAFRRPRPRNTLHLNPPVL